MNNYLRKYFAVIIMLRERARTERAHARTLNYYIVEVKVKGSGVYWSSGQEKELHKVKGSRLIFVNGPTVSIGVTAPCVYAIPEGQCYI